MEVGGTDSSSVNQAVAQAQQRINENRAQAAQQAAQAQETKAASASQESSASTAASNSDNVALSDQASAMRGRSHVASLDDESSAKEPNNEQLGISPKEAFNDFIDWGNNFFGGLFGSGQEKATISGTKGSDTIDVTIGEDGSYLVSVNGEETTYKPEEAEKLIIDGGDGSDTINIHGKYTSERELVVRGGAGDDFVFTDEDVQQDLTIDGGKGNDFIRGGAGNDTIIDKSGSTYAHGGAGNDTMKITGSGENRIWGEDGDDTIEGGSGRDYIEGGNGNDTINGKGGADVIYGNAGDDKISGDSGDDLINGGAGSDTLEGGAGNDLLFGLSGDDKLSGGAGDDVLIGGEGADAIDGGKGSDTIRTSDGTHGVDTVSGQEASDNIKKLNPIAVPANFKMDADQTQAFTNIVRDNLEAFAGFEPGQELLSGIAETGHNVYFQEIDVPNSYASSRGVGANMNITTDASGKRTYTPGTEPNGTVGSDSTVKLNPSLMTVNHAAWGEYNTMLTMAHEMSHTYNNSIGTRDMTYYNNSTGKSTTLPEGTTMQEAFSQGFITGAELQAVGIFPGSGLYDNPYGMRENDYREYFNMPKRDSYL